MNHIMSLCHLMGPLASFPCKTDKDKKKKIRAWAEIGAESCKVANREG